LQTKTTCLIVVHRKQLLEQWQERVQAFLGIPKQEIGIIGQGKTKIGKQITIATIQSLRNKLSKFKINSELFWWMNVIIFLPKLFAIH
jgi:superfamily II DNA or RNA helicase